jgi:type II secretory pathway component PulF
MTVTQDDVRAWARAFLASLTSGEVKSLVQHLADSTGPVSNEHLRRALTEVKSALEAGYSFSGSLAEHPDVFDKNFVTIVRYGEIHGEVDRTLQRFVERPEDMTPRCGVVEKPGAP